VRMCHLGVKSRGFSAKTRNRGTTRPWQTKPKKKNAAPLESSHRIAPAEQKDLNVKSSQKSLDAVGIEPTTFHSMLMACETKIIPLDYCLLVHVIPQREFVLHTQAPYQNRQ
jgi:hypothetical protein